MLLVVGKEKRIGLGWGRVLGKVRNGQDGEGMLTYATYTRSGPHDNNNS